MLYSPPSEWPEHTLAAWIKLVNETDGLHFNNDTISPNIVMKSLNVV